VAIDTSSYKEKAKVAVERRNYPYAIEVYQEILQIAPNDVDVRRSLRAVEIRQAKELGISRTMAILKNLGTYLKIMLPSRNHEQMIITCERYLASDPGNAKVLRKLAGALFAAGYKEPAAAVLEDLRQQMPDDLEGLRMLQSAYREMDEHKKALDINNEILKISPGDRAASQARRDLSATDMSEKFVEAATSGERGSAAQKIMKDEKEAERIRREALRTEDEVRAEIEAVRDDIKARPEDARLFVKLGNLYLRLRNFDEAEAQFGTAKELSPTEYTITMKLQDVDIARMRDAARKLSKAMQANRADARAKAAYRDAYYKLLDFRLKCFEEREKQFPTELNIAFELGNIYFEKSSLDEAIKRYQRTVHDPKNRAKSFLNLGISFQKKKQYDLALKQFTEGSDSLEIWNQAKMTLIYQRGDCYEEMGEPKKAEVDFTAIYEKDISFKDVTKRLAKYQKG
jgi:tetratricopeptide (TPR) repeat protein